jgi:predicted acylesterase/phospholipase RssA
MINTLVLSSGGVIGIAHIGVLKYLQFKNILPHIKCFSGCSVGALICFYHVLGYSPEDMLCDAHNTKIFPNVLTPEMTEQILVNTLTNASILSNNILVDHLEKITRKKMNNQLVTFKMLYELTKLELYIVAINETTQKPKYFSYKTTPDVYVHLAVAASCAVPIVFNPVLVHTEDYCDGVCMDPFPIKCVDTDDSRRILAIWLSTPNRFTVHSNTNVIETQHTNNIDVSKLIIRILKYISIMTRALLMKTIENASKRCLIYELEVPILLDNPLKTPNEETTIAIFKKGYELLNNKKFTGLLSEINTPIHLLNDENDDVVFTDDDDGWFSK